MEEPEEGLEAVYWRDEILQIMFWLRGEGIGDVVAPGDLLSLLGMDEETAHQQLEAMLAEGFVCHPEGVPDRYQLTAWGSTEGQRHFAAEFSGLLHQGHGECNNPDCACHTLGPEYCEHPAD